MRCNNCGADVVDGARFCTECGASLEQPFDNTANNWEFDRTTEQSGWEVAQDAWSNNSDQPQSYYGNPQSNYGGQQAAWGAQPQPEQQAWSNADQQAWNQQAYNQQAYNQQQGWNQGYNQGQNQPQSYGEKSKIAAGLLAIFLGAFGIHKFYLGYTKAGVIMLLVSVLSLFLLSWIMGIIALIEGIIYLTKDDYDFYMTYVANKKPWF